MMTVTAKRGMTRRSLLASAAGALAGGLARPGGALAALAGAAGPVAADPIRFARSIGTLSARAVTVDLGANADLVGVEWDARPGAAGAVGLELRFRGYDGSWSRWVSAGQHGHGPDVSAATSRAIGDPLWTGGTTTVQVRAGQTLSGVHLQLVDVSAGRGARRQALSGGPLATAAALPILTPALPAGPGQPSIIARRAWADGVSPPRVAPEYGDVEMAFVHHTENPNGYSPGEVPAMLRAIYVFHRYVNGWNDIGYNFVLDLFGRIFEARAGGIDEPVVGAQAGGYNIYSTGIAVLGSFSDVPISLAARASLERLLAWKLSLHGVSAIGRVTVRVDPAGARYSRFPAGAHVSLPHIAGHRDADATECPGNALYGDLPALRRSVQQLAGRPARVTLSLTAATAVPPGTGQPSAGEPNTGEPSTGAPVTAEPSPPTLTGALEFLEGTPIAGAPIEVQVRSVSRNGEVVAEQTLTQVTTAANGTWSVPISVSPPTRAGAWVRALCPGAPGVPAAVSEPLHLTGTVAVPTPTPTPSTPTPAPPGAPAPTP